MVYPSKSNVIWTLKELRDCLRQRQLNEFDANVGVSGKRGDGKSTFILKFLSPFKKAGFNQKKHQVYSQSDVMELLANQKFSFCWDDEAINSGYKRDFQKKGQKDLIKVMTNYRDNYNIYCSALPFFYSLDKDLRDLIFIHIHIIERGVAVILLPVEDSVHGRDPWDADTNIKIEKKENNRIMKNPNLRFRYHKLTTFAGYVYFGPMTKKQKRIYKEIKKAKRSKEYSKIEEKKDDKISFIERVYDYMIKGKLTKDGLIQSCFVNGRSYRSIIGTLNNKLKDNGETRTVSNFWKKEEVNEEAKEEIKNLVPQI